MKDEKITLYTGLLITIHDTIDNKTIDLKQDNDLIVLTHNEALQLADYITENIKKP